MTNQAVQAPKRKTGEQFKVGDKEFLVVRVTKTVASGIWSDVTLTDGETAIDARIPTAHPFPIGTIFWASVDADGAWDFTDKDPEAS